MMIKSNTLGKLQKIKNGNVFDSPLIFARELLQNSQRSRANTVRFFIDGNTLVCEDDGCGCSNPENVFTLDLSEWESTNEGYGIGFWACLAIPGIRSVSVQSKNWHFSVDTVKLFEKGDLTVSAKEAGNYKGFKVVIESDWFIDNLEELEQYIFDIAKYLPLAVYVNDLPTPHYDIFDSFEPDSFCKTYDNRIFKAKLALSNTYYDIVKMYYEGRFVMEEDYGYVKGVIEPKQGKLTLKEPDRTSYNRRDSLYSAFRNKLEECVKDLFRSYIAEYGVDDNDYNEGISYWLTLKDYEKYLSFENGMLQKSAKKKEPEPEPEEVQETCMDIVDFNPEDYKKEEKKTFQTFRPANIQTKEVASLVSVPDVKPANSFKHKVKCLKKAVWVCKSEYEAFKDDIQVAKYKGLDVIVAKNCLYVRALEAYGLVHISELKDHFHECYVKSNIELKNGKEAAFMALLRPICVKFGLSKDTFLICNLSIESSFEVDGKILAKDRIKNRRGEIRIFGVAGDGHIYLDRDALGLNRFNLRLGGGAIGIHDVKALMANVNTIAHEMAHLCKGTKDNTPEHYQAEIAYQREIIGIYI